MGCSNTKEFKTSVQHIEKDEKQDIKQVENTAGKIEKEAEELGIKEESPQKEEEKPRVSAAVSEKAQQSHHDHEVHEHAEPRASNA